MFIPVFVVIITYIGVALIPTYFSFMVRCLSHQFCEVAWSDFSLWGKMFDPGCLVALYYYTNWSQTGEAWERG